jgi:hypothetical protein
MATSMSGYSSPADAESASQPFGAGAAAPPWPARIRDPEVSAAGQLVIVTARWVLVLSGLLLALWNPGPIGQIRLHVLTLLILAVGNFYLHAQLLMRRPAVSAVAYAASAIDIAVITLLIATQGGFASSLYVFYFPALLAFSVAFPTSRTVGFGSVAVGLYACVGLFSVESERDAQSLVVRLLMLIAVAVCGNLFARIEASRRRTATEMPAEQAAAADIFFGQAVIIWARWFIILAGATLTLWTATSAAEITVNTILIVILMAMNFFLHGRYLTERPANRTLLAAVGVIDLLVITAIVMVWQAQVGLRSELFVFYYPIVLAFAFVMSPRLTAGYTAAALAAYVGACLLAGDAFVGAADAKLLVMRLITLASMGGLGAYYWRMQRQRRRAAHGGISALEELRARLGDVALSE